MGWLLGGRDGRLLQDPTLSSPTSIYETRGAFDAEILYRGFHEGSSPLNMLNAV
jgi:hypothetical protein